VTNVTLPCKPWQQWTLPTKAAVERKEKKRLCLSASI